MTVREPEWTEQDLAEAVALLKVEADTCQGCGEPLAESTDPRADGGYEVDDPDRCHGCTALNIQRDKHKDGRPLKFELRRTWREDDPDGGWRYG
ncbi:MAG: hypothetical protein ACRDP6_14675 [Actinoallomurus sp.]